MAKKRFVAEKGFINFDALKASGLSASEVDFSSKSWKRLQSRYERGKKVSRKTYRRGGK